jgi:hypothetical protein
MDEYKIFWSRIVLEGVYMVSAYMATDSYVAEDPLLGRYKTKEVQWSIITQTIPKKRVITGSLEKVIQMELHNFYAENIEILCAIALQSGSWKATEKIQTEIEDFIRFTVTSH